MLKKKTEYISWKNITNEKASFQQIIESMEEVFKGAHRTQVETKSFFVRYTSCTNKGGV
jgi:hypothetical protein